VGPVENQLWGGHIDCALEYALGSIGSPQRLHCSEITNNVESSTRPWHNESRCSDWIRVPILPFAVGLLVAEGEEEQRVVHDF